MITTRNDLPILGQALVSIEAFDGEGAKIDVSRLNDGTGSLNIQKIVFKTTGGDTYEMSHWQECCERVGVVEISGSANALIGEPLMLAEEVTSADFMQNADRMSWTFYRFATTMGFLDIAWRGQSNGYYSETAEFTKVTK